MLGFARSEGPVAHAGEDPEFISQRGCKKCHFKQTKSWKKTVHATAFETLKPGVKAEEKKALVDLLGRVLESIEMERNRVLSATMETGEIINQQIIRK